MTRVRLPDVIVHDRLAASELGEEIPWSLTDYGIPEQWLTTRARGIRVGIVDTGVDALHIESGDLVGAVVEQRDFTNSRRGAHDVLGHGTHVAGIVGAREGNGRGVAGVACEASLYVAKGLGDDGAGSDTDVAAAIRWCVSHGCRIINLSLGSDTLSRPIQDAVLETNRSNCLVVCAAGNSGGQVNYPARLKESLAVSAVDNTRRVAPFSSRGPEIDVAAPGVEILSSYLNGGYAVLSGTSMAAPWVSGLLALMLAADPDMDWTIDAIRRRLQAAAVDEGNPGKDYEYGYGLVNPSRAILRAPNGSQAFSFQVGPLRVSLPAVAGDVVSVGVDR